MFIRTKYTCTLEHKHIRVYSFTINILDGHLAKPARESKQEGKIPREKETEPEITNKQVFRRE